MGIGNAKAKFSLDVTNTGHAHLLLFHYKRFLSLGKLAKVSNGIIYLAYLKTNRTLMLSVKIQ